MIKREKLSKAEMQELHETVRECVFANVVFPPMQLGGSGTMVQELIHNRTVESLTKYADFLEQQGGKLSRMDKLNMVKEKTITNSDVTFSQAIRLIDLITKHKLYEEEKKKNDRRKREIREELAELKTPKERKAELEKELENL